MSDNNIPEINVSTTAATNNRLRPTQTNDTTEATTAANTCTNMKEESSSPTITNTNVQQGADDNLTHLPEKLRILKEAFPNTDIDVIEAVLQTQNDNVENTFELLLSMSDTDYKPQTVSSPSSTDNYDQNDTPPMPPRPSSQEQQSMNNSSHPLYTYWQRQAPTTVEEQLRMDEELAKKIAMEDELRAERRRQRHLQHQQQRQRSQQDEDEDSIFNFQEELPIIKEKMIEAGNAAKKKMLDFFNQIKTNTQKGNNSPPAINNQQSHINARYRGLPTIDDGDDLLIGDISAINLSDQDVYAKTGRKFDNDSKVTASHQEDGVIHVDPPLLTAVTNSLGSKIETSTSDAQLKADEDFARQLAEEEEKAARRRNHTPSTYTSTADVSSPPQMPPRKVGGPTVVIAPKSPLEFDSDYEDVRLTAAPTATSAKYGTTSGSSPNVTNATVPYVIGDDDDDDDESDNLVDIQADDGDDQKPQEKANDDAISGTKYNIKKKH
ncbi:hypothetical protein BDF20DRAFT_896046 [Mycotypha africana]|uniref:uncharacterized protein n=1 Tax=Mycotypha africana TaxID=64632 RepID=UPI002301F94F|nr:uncharacterized protein BDF20DRAFT_896046 [Mycotypha africana]KAI8968381.1 hypothetical protein BDF20DRAFT_896046 [Mycotypha africana]